MRILVTGCAGFIGFHLCNTLIKTKKRNIKIFGIDNLNNYYSKKLKLSRLALLKKSKKFSFKKIDISNFNKLEKFFQKKSFDLVINFAAQAGVRYALINPRAYIQSNIVGFHNLIELSKTFKVKKIIYASSSSVYGDRKKFPAIEKDRLFPKNIYAITKKNNEEIAELYSNIYNIKFIGLRFFTVYGPWGRPDMMILKYINSVKNKKDFNLFNNGNFYRDFTFVDDAINQLLSLMYKSNKNKHEIYNICSNKPLNIKKALFSIKEIFGKTNIRIKKGIDAEVFKTHGSNKKIINKTKVKKFTDFKSGLSKIYDWLQKNKNLI